MPKKRIHQGQLELAYRLRDAYQGKLIYVPGMGWLAWDGKVWIPSSTEAQEALRDVLKRALKGSQANQVLHSSFRRCESAGGLNGALKIAATLPGLHVVRKDLDVDPYLLNVSNGTLNLKTMELADHRPEDLLTNICNASYRLAAPPTRWDSFIREILPKAEVRDYFQRFIGLSLVGEVLEQVFTIASGEGANGKSKAYEALLHALGDYGYVAERDLFSKAKTNPGGPTPHLLRLSGKRLVVVSETENGDALAPALMKQLSGADRVRARPLYGDGFEFMPSHTSLMITNHLPRLPSDDPAVWRRVRSILFEVVFSNARQDRHLSSALRDSADGVLSWAIEGWCEYQKRGLDEPASVMAATEDYRRSQDDIDMFIKSQCITNVKGDNTLSELHRAYMSWAEVQGFVSPAGQRSFSTSLDQRGYGEWRTNGKKLRRGLKLIASSPTPSPPVGKGQKGLSEKGLRASEE